MHHQSLFVKFFHTAWNLFPCSIICNNLSTFVVSFCRCVLMLKKAQFMCLVVVYSQGRKNRRRNHYILRGLLQKRLNGIVCSSFTFFIRRAKSSSFFFSSSGDERAQETLFSGLYSYNCQTNTWNKLK